MGGHRQAGPDRAQGVVLVRVRDAEDGHESVAHDLRHRPAVLLHDQPEFCDPRPNDGQNLLRIERFGDGGVTGEVGEEDGYDLALGRNLRLTASRADNGVGRK
jgi:hypothetical protein